MSVDTIGDFLTIIRNGLMVNKRSVTMQHSKIKEQIALVLKNEGFIKDFKMTEEDSKKSLTIVLKYVDNESVIHEIVRKSKPGLRRYESCNQLTSVIGGLGVSILTTNRGVMSGQQAKKLNVGGEVICHVW